MQKIRVKIAQRVHTIHESIGWVTIKLPDEVDVESFNLQHYITELEHEGDISISYESRDKEIEPIEEFIVLTIAE